MLELDKVINYFEHALEDKYILSPSMVAIFSATLGYLKELKKVKNED